jgi:hypothetical protein
MTEAVDELDDDQQGTPDVGLLGKYVYARLRELRMSVLAASKTGIVSRSTLSGLRDGGRVPNYITLSKLDDLLSWEPGSARAAMYDKEPVLREKLVDKDGFLPPPQRMRIANDVDLDYQNLAEHITIRLRDLNMSRAKFAAIGGPGRSTLATMGKRGYAPTLETLARIDDKLGWEPGSSLTVLYGGVPRSITPGAAPHPASFPLKSVKDTLKGITAKLTRQAQNLEQLQADVATALERTSLALSELEDAQRSSVAPSSGTGTPDPGDAADQENSDD